MNRAIISFNSGELSPYLAFRSDVSRQASAAAVMENFLPMPFGAVTKRPGVVSLAATLAAGSNSIAFPFTASTGARYILHFTPGKLRVHRPDGTTAATLDFFPTYPWPGSFDPADTIRNLQMAQVNDVAFLTHPHIHPLTLRTTADTEWTLGFFDPERAPLLDGNLDKLNTLTLVSNPVAPSWVNSHAYSEGDVVFRGKAEWECIGTTDPMPAPGTVLGIPYWARKFYKKGDPVTLLNADREIPPWTEKRTTYHAGDFFSSKNYNPDWPINGTPWPTGQPAFEDFTSVYAPGFLETRACTDDGGGYFQTPIFYVTADYQPGWDEFSSPDVEGSGGKVHFFYPYALGSPAPVFYPGDYAFREGVLYRATDISSANGGDRTPGWGAYWTDYWESIGPIPYDAPPPYLPSGIYSPGDKVNVSGGIYECISHHYPRTSLNKPGSGSEWEYYWTLLSSSESLISDFFPGLYYKLSPSRHERDTQVEFRAIAANDGEVSPYIIVQGGWNLFTYGFWYGRFIVERSVDGGSTWEPAATYQSDADRNVAGSGTEDDPCFLRIRYEHQMDDDASPPSGYDYDAGPQRALLIPERQSVTGYALMTHYNDDGDMTGTARTSLMSGNTWDWSPGAFSPANGGPKALALHDRSLWFAGTQANPVSLWKSAIDDFDNFQTGTEDDDGIFLTLAAANAAPIRWLASQRRLFIGTSRAEWVAGSESSDLPVTPGNILIRQYTGTGSSRHQPLAVADSLLFLGRNGGRLYALAPAGTNETYQALDLSRLAEHLTSPGLVSFAWQGSRDRVLWLVRKNGGLLSLHYAPEEEITAWARHAATGWKFLDVVTFPGDAGDDHVFFILRSATSTDTRLARFPAGWQAAMESGSPPSYLDLGDSPVSSTLATFPIDAAAESATTAGQRKRAHKLDLNLYNSQGGSVTCLAPAQNLPIPGGDLFTGWVSLTLTPGHTDDLTLTFTHAENSPFTLRSAVLGWMPHEPTGPQQS